MHFQVAPSMAESICNNIWAASWQYHDIWHVRPAKTQISLGFRPVWSQSSLCAQWVAKDPSFFHADSEDSDQTGCMLGAHAILLVLSRGCSFVFRKKKIQIRKKVCYKSQSIEDTYYFFKLMIFLLNDSGYIYRKTSCTHVFPSTHCLLNWMRIVCKPTNIYLQRCGSISHWVLACYILYHVTGKSVSKPVWYPRSTQPTIYEMSAVFVWFTCQQLVDSIQERHWWQMMWIQVIWYIL